MGILNPPAHQPAPLEAEHLEEHRWSVSLLCLRVHPDSRLHACMSPGSLILGQGSDWARLLVTGVGHW